MFTNFSEMYFQLKLNSNSVTFNKFTIAHLIKETICGKDSTEWIYTWVY